jgi:hypothetical protein
MPFALGNRPIAACAPGMLQRNVFYALNARNLVMLCERSKNVTSNLVGPCGALGSTDGVSGFSLYASRFQSDSAEQNRTNAPQSYSRERDNGYDPRMVTPAAEPRLVVAPAFDVKSVRVVGKP